MSMLMPIFRVHMCGELSQQDRRTRNGGGARKIEGKEREKDNGLNYVRAFSKLVRLLSLNSISCSLGA